MIIIMGDSWGVGEWGSEPGRGCVLAGPGIGQYFSLHGKVINFSEGNADNLKQKNEFELLLAKFRPSSEDRFYWIVTDPLRHQDPHNLLHNACSIRIAAQQQLDYFYKSISALATAHDIVIQLIGGLCDIEPICYNNLRVVVPSWCKILYADHYESIFTDHTIRNLSPYIRKDRPDLKTEWIELANETLLKRKSFDYLQKIGMMKAGHPTGRAHRQLRDVLSPDFRHIY